MPPLPPTARSQKHRRTLELWACTFLSIVASIILFAFTRQLLLDELRIRLTAIAAAAASQIDPQDVESVRTTDDITSGSYRSLVTALRRLRDTNGEITFAYIMRETSDPLHPSFVADADASLSVEQRSASERSAGLPGTPYDASAVPALREGFRSPSADDSLEQDPWGLTISGYAPIRTGDGRVAGMLGIDMSADDFYAHVRRSFIPTLVFILMQIGLLLLMLHWVYWYRQQTFAQRKG